MHCSQHQWSLHTSQSSKRLSHSCRTNQDQTFPKKNLKFQTFNTNTHFAYTKAQDKQPVYADSINPASSIAPKDTIGPKIGKPYTN